MRQNPTTLQEPHAFNDCRGIILTVDDPRAPVPPGFQGSLWAPQATLLQAMLDLENRPALTVKADENGGTNRGGVLTTRAARIAAEFSFGKTVLCAALISASRCPRAFPSGLNIIKVEKKKKKSARRPRRMPRGVGEEDYVEGAEDGAEEPVIGQNVVGPVLLLRYQRLIEATFVLASGLVIGQWAATLRRFAPGLRFIVVYDFKSLQGFYAEFARGGLAGTQVVLVKTGQARGFFGEEGGEAGGNPAMSRETTLALAAATEGYVWGRAIVDDFDSINLTKNDALPPALFTWFVSATFQRPSVRSLRHQDPPPLSDGTVEGFVRMQTRPPLINDGTTALLDGLLKLTCDPQYVSEHVKTTSIEYRRIIVNGGRGVNGILTEIGAPPEVLEMVAAGAIATAADALDIRVSSVGELVGVVLGHHLSAYKKACRARSRCTDVRREAARLTGGGGAGGGEAEGAEGGGAAERSSYDRLVATLEAGGSAADEAAAVAAAAAELAHGPPLFRMVFQEMETRVLADEDERGKALRRLRENVSQNACQACQVPLEEGEGHAFLVNCCQVIICAHCILEKKGGVAGFRTHCPNCIAEISPKNHLFYVGTDILQSPEGVYEEAASLQAEAAGGFPFPEMAARLRVLVQLLRGEPVSFERSGPLSEEGGILSGRRSCPLPANAPHKYLIFAMYSESMHQIAAALAAGGVAFAELGGGRAKIEEAVARFRAEKGPSILIAKSSTKCAGLHLPEVTRIVFYHHHQNKEVVKQGIGRAQRVGREYNLEVIEILDEGEAAAGRRRGS